MCVAANDEGKMSFEDALTTAGFGLYSLLMAALAGVAIISFACIFYSSTIVVPISACELATSGAQQGMLVAGPIVGAILGAVVWGYIADCRGRRNTLMTSLLLGAGVNVLASLSTNWIMLLTLQFIASLMISGQFSLAMTILSESVPLARRNLVILLVTSIFLLSQGLMAVLAMPIIPMSFSYHLPYLDIQWTSWRLLLVVYSLPSLLTALWLSYMQESPKFVYSKGDEEKALEILKVIHRVNHRRCANEFQVKGLLMRRPSSEGAMTSNNHFALLFTPPLLNHTLIMTLLFLLEQLAAFKVWLPTIAHRFVQVVGSGQGRNLTLCSIIANSLDDQRSEDTAPSAAPCALDFEALLIVLVVTLMLSMTNALMTLGVERIGRRYMVMLVTCVSGASSVLVNLVPSAAASAALFVLQLMGIVALGLYTALSVALFPTRLRALAMTLTMTGARVASFMSIQIINYLLTHNCELAFYVYGFLLAFSAVVAYFLPGDAPTRCSQHEILQEEPDG